MLGRKKAEKRKNKMQTDSGVSVSDGSLYEQLGSLCEQADVPYEQQESVWYSQQDSDPGEVTRKIPGREPVTLDLSKRKAVRAARGGSVQIGTSSVIGSRKTQQDSVFGYQSSGWALGIVCDGMGGLAGGEIASRVALQSIADAWFAQSPVADIPDFFRKEAASADQKVYSQTAADGSRMQAGTTVVAAVVRGNGLYWLSVGDSKLYFIRGQEIQSLNVEHNYRLELNNRLREGSMTAQEYAAEEYRAEALTSFLGIGSLSEMDVSPRAYPLQDGDLILLASDGLYRSLTEEEILAIVAKHSRDMQQAADALTAAVRGRKKQDNTSVVILRYIMEKQT